MHFAAKLTRSSWAPTISLGSHQNIGLHTGARANVVLLTYFGQNLVQTGKSGWIIVNTLIVQIFHLKFE